MHKILLPVCLATLVTLSQSSNAQEVLGSVVPNTNLALPSSYAFQEYQFAEPDDQGSCAGMQNGSAKIEKVFFSQTHRHEVDHPFFFSIGLRPILLQLAVTGTGASPDVQVEGFHNDASVGVLCLKGPANLPAIINFDIPDFESYFSVTIPKDWVTRDLELRVKAGENIQFFDKAALKVGPYTEMNLVMYNMDILDYNINGPTRPYIDDFIAEIASAIPASVVRFGVFPEKLRMPELLVHTEQEELARLSSRSQVFSSGAAGEGSINSVATIFMSNIHQATNDYLSTIYFGNTLNLAPGGWGGGRSFVGFEYEDVFLHELGHALSLPHWGETSYNISNPNIYDYRYPYGGETDDGGGRGESWNFLQYRYEFVDPVCQDPDSGNGGKERSDAMQRNHFCLEQRADGKGPWDGFGDFSAYAMHRFMVGDENTLIGDVDYRQESKAYQFSRADGAPLISRQGNERVYTRLPGQNQNQSYFEYAKLPGTEQLDKEVYLLYGTAHQTQEHANLIYKPVKYTGTLPAILDPTNPETFEELKNPAYIDRLYGTRDLTFKITYEDGSILHALNPYASFERGPYQDQLSIWRRDLVNWALVVPGDKEIARVEMYHRPFCQRFPDDNTAGNILDPVQNITAQNFMDAAVWKTEYYDGQPKIDGAGSIGNMVWNDLNRNGVRDHNEPGIPDVKLVLWSDSNGDDIPDYQGFEGVATTDENGIYGFSGLNPGTYMVFVWEVDNYDQGGPLENMIGSEGYSDPNSDIDDDDNGKPGGDPDLPDLGPSQIGSGLIVLTSDGEPLDDGDYFDDWVDYDSSGNQTVDFGFHSAEGCAQIDIDLAGGLSLCLPDAGTIEAIPTGGQGPYEIAWSNGHTGPTISDLEMGTHIVSVVDAFGCTGQRTFDITPIADIQVSFTAPESVCFEGLANIQAIATNGQPPYHYEWNTGESGAILNDKPAAEYMLTVTDANTCTKSFSLEIEEIEPLSLSISGTDSLCAGALGVLTANVTNGGGAVTFQWDDGTTGAELEGAGIGIHTVAVTEANGCQYISTYEIFAKSPSDCALGFWEDNLSERIRIFPNPFTNTIKIELPLDGSFSIELYSILGQKLFSNRSQDPVTTVMTSSYPAGYYIVVVKSLTGQVIKTKRIIKY